MPLGHYVSDLFLCSDISQYGDLVFNIHNFVEDHIEAGKVHAFKGAKHEHLKLAIQATKREVNLPGKVCA